MKEPTYTIGSFTRNFTLIGYTVVAGSKTPKYSCVDVGLTIKAFEPTPSTI